MRLGAQLYSVRGGLKTPEDIRKTFEKIREIGYDAVQFSGAPTKDAEGLRAVSEETGLPIVCTHISYERLINETDEVIAEHKTFGCPVIGLGSMPKEFHGSLDGLETFLENAKKPVAKILDSGLHFAYHNHAFEFEKAGDGRCLYDIMLERCPDWHMIMDTYWVEFAGYSAEEYLKKIGGARLQNVHFKDMANDEKRSICACGAGTLNFACLAEVCRELGVQNVLVEQDNANDLPDPFAAMQESFQHLKPLFKH